MGTYDNETEEPFWLFQQGTQVRYCRYRDSDKLLGNTFDMCILQDFEALTPNLLCRTIETVEGGGLVIILLKTMENLEQLYTLTLDAHRNFESTLPLEMKPRFCERLILSLTDCPNCLVMDDELNVLPISKRQLDAIPPLPPGALLLGTSATDNAQFDEALNKLKADFAGHSKIGPILRLCCTLDQAQCVADISQYFSSGKLIEGSLAVTSARGRGKSAALGLAVAMAVAYGLKNIFITAPSPENTQTLFDFACKALVSLGLVEQRDFTRHVDAVSDAPVDFDHLAGSNPAEYQKRSVTTRIVVRSVNLGADSPYAQTIQYVKPTDTRMLGLADVLLVDEAAAIQLPVLRQLLGHYLVIMASTVDGYEGTGRALTLKVFKDLQLRQTGGMKFRQIVLQTAIRYQLNDPIEAWLKRLLRLDACDLAGLALANPEPDLERTCLFRVNRDSLFMFHNASEAFLLKVLSLFNSSLHRISPNDLLTLSDSPAHDLFVLCPSLDRNSMTAPDVLCVLEVCYEGGAVNEEQALSNNKINEGSSYASWTISQYFTEPDFRLLTGARITKLATHPDVCKTSYGKRATSLFVDFLKRDPGVSDSSSEGVASAVEKTPLLLHPVASIGTPFAVDWVAACIDLNEESVTFWEACRFSLVWTSQHLNSITNEFEGISLRQVRDPSGEDREWASLFSVNFSRRFAVWLETSYRALNIRLAATILESSLALRSALSESLNTELSGSEYATLNDETELQNFDHSNGQLLPQELLRFPAHAFFRGQCGDLCLDNESFPLIKQVLLGAGLQGKAVRTISKELSVQPEMVDQTVNKCVAIFASFFAQFWTQSN